MFSHQWVHKRTTTTLQFHTECVTDGRETELWTRAALRYHWALLRITLNIFVTSVRTVQQWRLCAADYSFVSNAREFCAGEINRISLLYFIVSLKYWNGSGGSDMQCGSQDVGVSARKRPCLSVWPNEIVLFKIKLLASKRWFSTVRCISFPIHLIRGPG